MERLGDWDAGPGGEMPYSMAAVFSGSDTLLDPSLAHRVPDAIDAGPDFVTGTTWHGGEPTDIPEDFRVAAGETFSQACVEIPSGATHLFVSPLDSLYHDNSDPDGDFAVRITLIDCPPDRASPPDGVIDVIDLLAVLGAWGEVGSDCDGVVSVTDLLAVLGNWGPC